MEGMICDAMGLGGETDEMGVVRAGGKTRVDLFISLSPLLLRIVSFQQERRICGADGLSHWCKLYFSGLAGPRKGGSPMADELSFVLIVAFISESSFLFFVRHLLLSFVCSLLWLVGATCFRRGPLPQPTVRSTLLA